MWELNYEEGWAPKNWCFWNVVLEKTPESPLDCKEIQPVHSEGDMPWNFFGMNDAKAETPVPRSPHEKSWLIGKRLWCWEGLRAGEEGGDRGWDGWMASRTRWTWVWVNSGRWWWTGRPDVLRFMGSQRVGHDWVTELNWTDLEFRFWSCILWPQPTLSFLPKVPLAPLLQQGSLFFPTQSSLELQLTGGVLSLLFFLELEVEMTSGSPILNFGPFLSNLSNLSEPCTSRWLGVFYVFLYLWVEA